MMTPTHKPTILVTGGSGLVGSAVKEFAKGPARVGENWVFVNSQDADLMSYDQTTALFRKHKPQYVLHLAARVGGLFDNMQNNLEMFRCNMQMQDNINRCCVDHHVNKLVSCLSTCIFPDGGPFPITESDLHDGPPHSSNAGYAYAKRMVDVQNKLYNSCPASNTLFTSVVPTNVYGKMDNFNAATAHVIPGLIRKCHLAKLSRTQFVVAGSGAPLRQFIHSSDLARLLGWVTLCYKEEDPIILADPREYSIKAIAETIAAAMEYEGPIVYDTTKADGQLRKTVSNAKLLAYLPEFEFQHDLHNGIQDTVRWYLNNTETART